MRTRGKVYSNPTKSPGAFVWRYEGLESRPCRILAYTDAAEPEIEAVALPHAERPDVPPQSVN
ncbi:MAG: hypothetical protein J2P54_21120 [Bradyrhizobiaceae bacterium]|nr:hypothetical protein [Bradyrhizobiaceae bacterium]